MSLDAIPRSGLVSFFIWRGFEAPPFGLILVSYVTLDECIKQESCQVSDQTK
jgi:hypothetical protein